MSDRAGRRDHEVIDLLATGMTTREIAARLGLEIEDVERRVERVLVIHSFSTRADLLFAAALGQV